MNYTQRISAEQRGTGDQMAQGGALTAVNCQDENGCSKYGRHAALQVEMREAMDGETNMTKCATMYRIVEYMMIL